MSQLSSKLSQKITGIKNSVTEINKSIITYKRNIAGNQSLLNSLQSILEQQGEAATVRLKNDHFKYGQASHFFKKMLYGSRYQTERDAAVEKVNAAERTVSAGEVRKTLQIRIDSALTKVNELKNDVIIHGQSINHFQAKKDGIEKKIDKLAKIEADAKKAEEKKDKIRQNFSMIYQSNAGCKALNIEARHQFGNAPSAGKLSASAVVEEYRRVHGYEIFSRGNKALESTIKANCSDLRELVKTAANAWYTPTEKNITTYRGQGITQSGINALISGFNADEHNKTETLYHPGQFFSTSWHLNVASDFANRSQDDVKVIYKMTGNSSNVLSVAGGLSFENDEGERLYSPLTNVKVTAISRVAPDIYHIALEEVPSSDRARLLPY
ncbi:hypothetical protein BLD46_16055 [Erwinia sp. OLMTSP26]|nr:hypothetical protein BLD46_16055 [Erwinia sp. OLMTSP26]